MNEFEQIEEPKIRWRITRFDNETGKVLERFEDSDLDTAYQSANTFLRQN
jgi:hypothetical protein